MSRKPTVTDGGAVRVCTMDDAEACALTLAHAFSQDDVAFYCLDTPDNGGRTREELWPLHLKFMEWLVRGHIYQGLVLATGPSYEGVALWYTHNCHPPDLQD